MMSPDDQAIMYNFSSGGVEVRILVHGPQKKDVIDFFQYYFAAFPSKENTPDVEIHYYTHESSSEFSKENHPYWNETFEEFDVERTGAETIIYQRDFIALQNSQNVIFATGPTLNQGCCDSTDNLVQYALGKHLIGNGVLPLHAAAVVVNKEAFIFFGESGAGKSTLATTSFENHKYAIMAGDQIFLQESEGVVQAIANTTTIFGFHRDNLAWDPGPYPVKGIFHLKALPRRYAFQRSDFKDLLPVFLRETVSWKEVIDPALLLDLVLKLGQNKALIWGEFTYQKTEDFWPQLLQDLKYETR